MMTGFISSWVIIRDRPFARDSIKTIVLPAKTVQTNKNDSNVSSRNDYFLYYLFFTRIVDLGSFWQV